MPRHADVPRGAGRHASAGPLGDVGTTRLVHAAPRRPARATAIDSGLNRSTTSWSCSGRDALLLVDRPDLGAEQLVELLGDLAAVLGVDVVRRRAPPRSGSPRSSSPTPTDELRDRTWYRPGLVGKTMPSASSVSRSSLGQRPAGALLELARGSSSRRSSAIHGASIVRCSAMSSGEASAGMPRDVPLDRRQREAVRLQLAAPARGARRGRRSSSPSGRAGSAAAPGPWSCRSGCCARSSRPARVSSSSVISSRSADASRRLGHRPRVGATDRVGWLTTVTVRVSQSTAAPSPDSWTPIMAEQPQAFVYDPIRTPRGKGKKVGSLHEVKPVDLVVGLLDEIKARNPGARPAPRRRRGARRGHPDRRPGRRHRQDRRARRRATPRPSPASSSTGSAPPASRPSTRPRRGSAPASRT